MGTHNAIPLSAPGAAVLGLVLLWLAALAYAGVNAFYLWPRGIDRVALARTADPGASTAPAAPVGYRRTPGHDHHH